MWQHNGHGIRVYVNKGYVWKYDVPSNPTTVPAKNNYAGSYRREISIPAYRKRKGVIVHFGSMTSKIYLWVNRKYVSYREDSKQEAEIDQTAT